jgi:hypothetical protein
VSLRKSGKIDLYYNYALSKDSDDTMEDIQITMGYIWGKKRLKPTDEDLTVLRVDCQDLKGRISFEFAKNMSTMKDSKWELLQFECIKGFVKMFTNALLF